MAIPMIMYLLRLAPLFGKELLNELDKILKSSLECILNTEAWKQASLPISSGGIGIRKLFDVEIPAYCSSVRDPAQTISPISITTSNENLESTNNAWKTFTDNTEIPS